MRHVLMPQSPVCWVRADTSIAECVKLLRDRSLGALVVLSDDDREDLVGIFTERDLVRNVELIQRGGFWDAAVRTVMSASVRTVKVEELDLAPKLMARYNIRHLPVVKMEKGRKRVVGVISMRDIFRIVMEQLDFDLGRVFFPPKPAPRRKKLVGVFSKDKAILDVVERGAKLTRHFLVKACYSPAGLQEIAGYFDQFDALLVDVDGLTELQLVRLVAEARELSRRHALFLSFNPLLLSDRVLADLHLLADGARAQLLSKPIALGLLYEKFLKELK